MFNSLSLGRNRNNNSASKSPNEALSAHPLLGAVPGSGSVSELGVVNSGSADDASKTPGGPSHKPRQRHGGGGGGSQGSSIGTPFNVASSQSAPALNVLSASKTPQPSAVTTASPAFASSNPSPTGQAGNSVTSRLQLQSLKAAGQRMGLGNGSAGIQMLETLFEKAQVSRSGSGGDWGEIIKVLTAGKATLLLPSVPGSSLPVTTQSLRDHIMFPACGTSTGSVFVTMSGLIGVIEEDKITFESCFAGDSALLQALKNPNTRSVALASLQPLRASTSTNVHFPSFNTGAANGLLPFPPLPPPPPTSNTGNRSRSGSSASLASIPPIASSRLNPFASLFGSSSGHSSNAPNTPPRGGAAELSSSPGKGASALSPRPPSIASLPPLEVTTEQAAGALEPEGYQFPAWSIDKIIKYGEVCKSLGKAIRRNVTDELEGLPDKIVERVARFVLVSHPCSTEIKNVPGTPLLSVNSPTMDAPLDFHAKADHVSESLQIFFESVYDDLLAHYSSAVSVPQSPSGLGSLRRRGSQKGKASHEDTEKTLEASQRREKQKLAAEEAAERQAIQALDVIEKVVCCLLYNFLFAPSVSDDLRHDEALSSRVAALNLLELSLDHLGVKTKESDPKKPDEATLERDRIVAEGLETIVNKVGQVLQSLDLPENHTPKRKSEILVQAHKVVIDGLQQLPTIRLRPEGETYQSPDASSQPTAIDQALEMPLSSVDSETASVPGPRPGTLASLSSASDRSLDRGGHE